MMSFHPQTPQSPSQLSPSTTDPMTSMTSSMTSSTVTLPTPAHSVNGSSMLPEANNDAVMSEDLHQKRKRSGDEGERDQKKVDTEGRRYGIENLHANMDEKYLLCRTPYPPPRSQMSEDVFDIFGLTGIAAEVARVLPNGEKNSLRKTYKGHIKKLGVEGHFDAAKEAWERPDSLLNLAKCPKDEWNVHFVRGKDIKDGFAPEVKSKLARALMLGREPVPKSVWDISVLGDLNAAKTEKQPASARPTAPNTPLPSGLTPIHRSKPSSGMSAAEANRPKRNILKRGYGDSSFEGYDEGFPDDDGGAGGYSTGEGEMGSGRKRIKKSHPVGQQSYGQGRQPGYGLCMSNV
ncbi:hypothetical protein QBC39DRAFT_128093 [Podospora conica]|nr:hypothetical protein QBC39DRAFT_128093 [Schizothecium conicum]